MGTDHGKKKDDEKKSKIKPPLKKAKFFEHIIVDKTKKAKFKEISKTAQIPEQTQKHIDSGVIPAARDRLAEELRFWRTIPKFIRPPKPKLADFLPKKG